MSAIIHARVLSVWNEKRSSTCPWITSKYVEAHYSRFPIDPERRRCESLGERVKAPFSQCPYRSTQFFRSRVLLLRASTPPHNYREPRHPDASDYGHEPLLPRHAGKLEQNGVNPAHGGLAGRSILGAGRANRKTEHWVTCGSRGSSSGGSGT